MCIFTQLWIHSFVILCENVSMLTKHGQQQTERRYLGQKCGVRTRVPPGSKHAIFSEGGVV